MFFVTSQISSNSIQSKYRLAPPLLAVINNNNNPLMNIYIYDSEMCHKCCYFGCSEYILLPILFLLLKAGFLHLSCWGMNGVIDKSDVFTEEQKNEQGDAWWKSCWLRAIDGHSSVWHTGWEEEPEHSAVSPSRPSVSGKTAATICCHEPQTQTHADAHG